MTTLRRTLILLMAAALLGTSVTARSWIRINQLGYLPRSIKVAVLLADSTVAPASFEVRDAATDVCVMKGTPRTANGLRWGMKTSLRLDFSKLTAAGRYYITSAAGRSPEFRIGSDVYNGSADVLLNYMRQQRCGYNPYLDTICHQHDGYIVYHPTRSGERIDVRGGWHDASDYLQYLPTSANATFQMLFAWQQHPDTTLFGDRYDALGRKGSNGVPDILDEARWGLQWLMRMNPDSAVMFNQIADDRDHAGMRMPNRDMVDYGWGKGTGRPVYFITGRPQGEKYMNRTTGVASSAGKFSSAFTLGAAVFRAFDASFADSLAQKALPAYHYAEALPGNTQTICIKSPYFYEEDNYTDDVELAASVNAGLTGDRRWTAKADYWGRMEEITPWMELNRARHYQYYPFVNLGHYYMATSDSTVMRTKYRDFMRRGLEAIRSRAVAEDDPFCYGIPFVWCSNNLVAATLTEARLYNEVSGDTTYMEMEAALRDWLFGCNPWGSSMLCGYPDGADTPMRAHSALVVRNNDTPTGGLVDGPIYRTLYESLLGVHLNFEDPYAPFQAGVAVYHDDTGDYSSNEPTMDGTASLSYYLSTMQHAGRFQTTNTQRDATGATVRMDTTCKKIYLIFSADERFEGADIVLDALKRAHIKGSFFLTGNCLRNKAFTDQIARITAEGHYLGGHSDNHLLYATWGDRKPLVTADSLITDLRRNRDVLYAHGVQPADESVILPPYEHCTADNVRSIEAQGLQVINLTPEVGTAADYTTPDMKNYRSSRQLIEQLTTYEKSHGLNGAILLIHPGTEPTRTDKFYRHLGEVINILKHKGYSFARF